VVHLVTSRGSGLRLDWMSTVESNTREIVFFQVSFQFILFFFFAKTKRYWRYSTFCHNPDDERSPYVIRTIAIDRVEPQASNHARSLVAAWNFLNYTDRHSTNDGEE
jgi:hypothetical protein